jgi:minor extracellular protease Epr
MRLKPSVRWILFPAFALLVGGASHAQLLQPVPNVGGVLGGVGDIATDALDRTSATLDDVRATTRRLAEARTDRLNALVRRFPVRLEMTDLGPAVRGEVVAIDPDPATLAAVRGAGFVRLGDDVIDGLGFSTVTLRVPRGWSIDRALSRLGRIAPNGEFVANHLHLQSGPATAASIGAAALAQGGISTGPAIGMIDGGVAGHPALRGAIEQRGFVAGAPLPSAHGTAVASLIAGQGPIRGAAPGARLFIADVYGTDPAGGNAVAVARALGWLAQSRVPVVAISLVGPANRLVARAIAQAQARGIHIVAAVGNDGPAAPPAFPASYPSVIAVTGVDARNRVIIEAGRASHLDYAAPGADMAAARAGGTLMPVRGTSFAVPFVAGRLAQHVRGGHPLAALNAEAIGRGRRGLGRGVVCADCRTPYRRN